MDARSAAAAPIGLPIGDRPVGLRDVTIQDPAGFEIRFAQILK